MKKILIIFTMFTLCNISFALGEEKTMTDFFAVRYKSINYGGAAYMIDFKNVQAIIEDRYAHISAMYGPSRKDVNWNQHYDWIFFKNGDKIPIPHDKGAITDWTAYLNLIRDNPKFISLP